MLAVPSTTVLAQDAAAPPAPADTDIETGNDENGIDLAWLGLLGRAGLLGLCGRNRDDHVRTTSTRTTTGTH